MWAERKHGVVTKGQFATSARLRLRECNQVLCNGLLRLAADAVPRECGPNDALADVPRCADLVPLVVHAFQ